MALQGNIDSFSVVDVLRLLGSSRKSGRLVVDGDRGSGSLWLVDGLVEVGETTRSGATSVSASPSEVLFDLLRFREGSFVFEAGESSGSAGGPEPVDVESLIVDVEEAMAEWDAITAAVPSTRSALSLAPRLDRTSVTLDERLWAAVVAVAEERVAAPDGACIDGVAHRLGLSELPAMRLARDLVDAGVVVVGPEVAAGVATARSNSFTDHDAADASHEAAFEPAAFEPGQFEPAPFVPAAFEPGQFEPAPFEAGPFEPGAVPSSVAEPMVIDPVTWEPTVTAEQATGFSAEQHSEPVADPVVEPLAAADETPFDAFARFDPFGTAPPADATTDAFAGATADPWRDGPSDPQPDVHPMTDPVPVSAPSSSPVDDAALQADLARQLAMLSPRAAEAVAIAEAGPVSEDEERARVARFLGSV